MREELSGYFNGELYGITCFERSRGRGNIAVAIEMLKGGVRVVQYREKYRPARVKYAECLKLRELTREYKALLIVNDDVDLALICQADGLHLGQDDLPLAAAKQLLGRDQIIGLSTHNPHQAEEAFRQGADYIGVGPVFSTDTKEGVHPPVGLKYIDYVAKHIPIPFVAIGGIKSHNLESVLESGAKCVALVTALTESDDIACEAKRLRARIKDGLGEKVTS